MTRKAARKLDALDYLVLAVLIEIQVIVILVVMGR